MPPARTATGFGVSGDWGVGAASGFALRGALVALATTGSIPMTSSPASVAMSVVP